MITSKSLHGINIVFLFRERAVEAPTNEIFARLFGGDDTRGVYFFDDPHIQTKMLSVPARKLEVFWEGRRLRIEDRAIREPDDSTLVRDAWEVIHKLFPNPGEIFEGMGVNMDVYFQFKDVIRLGDIFLRFNPMPLDFGDAIKDLGFQWTIQKKDASLEGYFVKVTAPLELAVHLNRHFLFRKLPTVDEFAKLVEESYRELDGTIGNLSL